MKIERIQQRGSNDCGVAALAMACGASYDEIAPLLLRGSGDGVNEPDLYEWLRENGWAWQIVYQNFRALGKYHKRDPWPPKPFAPSHIVMVQATQAWHFTVMDSSGTVFDPWTADRTTLSHPDYRQISWVMGIWRARHEPTNKAVREAYDEWSWTKEGTPIGYMAPGDAARDAFQAGIDWALTVPRHQPGGPDA